MFAINHSEIGNQVFRWSSWLYQPEKLCSRINPCQSVREVFPLGCIQRRDSREFISYLRAHADHAGNLHLVGSGVTRTASNAALHYDNAAARPIEVVSDAAENRRGPLCN